MRADCYVKVCLTLIVLLLGIIAIRPLVQPDTVLAQSSKWSDLQFSTSTGILAFFDTRTGDVWGYTATRAGTLVEFQPEYAGKLTELGKPLVK